MAAPIPVSEIANSRNIILPVMLPAKVPAQSVSSCGIRSANTFINLVKTILNGIWHKSSIITRKRSFPCFFIPCNMICISTRIQYHMKTIFPRLPSQIVATLYATVMIGDTPSPVLVFNVIPSASVTIPSR